MQAFGPLPSSAVQFQESTTSDLCGWKNNREVEMESENEEVVKSPQCDVSLPYFGTACRMSRIAVIESRTLVTSVSTAALRISVIYLLTMP